MLSDLDVEFQERQGLVMFGKLENEHRHVVADASKGIKPVWLISGPVFLNGQAEKVIGPDKLIEEPRERGHFYRGLIADISMEA